MSLVEKIISNLEQKSFHYVLDLEKRICNYKLTSYHQKSLIDNEDKEIMQTYFYLYTLPILEGLGILEDKEKSIFWGTVQLCLGLHLRYIDYIIDDDKIDKSKLLITQKSIDYLLKTQILLAQNSYSWNCEQMSIYMQYFDYENEIRSNQFHDFGGLWRRVSPLFIISGSYLKSSHKIDNFDFYYKRYISCSLLKADCRDIIKDIGKQKTPITILLHDYDSQIDKNVTLMANKINYLESKINEILTQIKRKISNTSPIWKIVIESLIF